MRKSLRWRIIFNSENDDRAKLRFKIKAKYEELEILRRRRKF